MRLLILLLLSLSLLTACGLKRNLELPGGKNKAQAQQTTSVPATTTPAAPTPTINPDVAVDPTASSGASSNPASR